MIKISVDYSPPSSFTLAPPSYRAASALNLSCEVQNVDKTAMFYYEWTSTCSGRCFTGGALTANVSTIFLHSYDSGVHICTVHDDRGCVGSANITVNVVGNDDDEITHITPSGEKAKKMCFNTFFSLASHH